MILGKCGRRSRETFSASIVDWRNNGSDGVVVVLTLSSVVDGVIPVHSFVSR